MSLFKNIFKSTSEEDKAPQSNINWIPLTTLEQLTAIKTLSNKETVLVFKHSTRCGISRMVIKQFEKKFAASGKKTPLYYLDLLNYTASISAVISRTKWSSG